MRDGSRYNPTTDSSSAVTNIGAPGARDYHTAVWNGTEMIVWGGQGTSALSDGARYNPTTDSWIAIPGATQLYLYLKP